MRKLACPTIIVPICLYYGSETLITEMGTTRDLQTNYFRSIKISPQPLVCHRKDVRLRPVKFLWRPRSPILPITVGARSPAPSHIGSGMTIFVHHQLSLRSLAHTVASCSGCALYKNATPTVIDVGGEHGEGHDTSVNSSYEWG